MKIKSYKTDIRTQIYLTKKEYEYLQRQSEAQQASIAEVVRHLIDEKMPGEKDYEDNLLFSISKNSFSMGRKEGSEKHDDYIYRGKK